MSALRVSSYVDGEWRADGTLATDINPARPSEVVAEVCLADAAVAREAVASASHAFAAWRATSAPARGEILHRAATRLEQRLETVARDMTREEGKTIGEAIAETKRTIGILRYYAGQALEPDGEIYPSHASEVLLLARREPVGVILAITPWNFPLAIPAWKIAPALVFGNTVVWEPSELVPVTAVHLVEVLVEAGLPAGVLDLVLGRSTEVGDPHVLHERVDAISFTGSGGAGREIQRRATLRGARVQLELGGKNPAVVLADANLDHATEQVARGAFSHAGQKCTATSRVIVERSVLPQFAERLVHLAGTWRVGDPLDPETKVGPLVSEERLRTVVSYIEAGGRDGKVLAGGGRVADLDGYFVRPTVIAEVAASSPVAREEIFGPVITLLPAEDLEQAIALANDTPFGLSAALFTRDLGKALRFARDVRVGVVKINQETPGIEFQAPFGGVKESGGGGAEQGKAAREFYTHWKTVYVQAPAALDP